MIKSTSWVDARLQRGGRPWRKIHLDFHNMPAVGDVGTAFDPDEFISTLRAASVDAIVVFAKDMHGWFYYPAARSAAVFPGLERDLMGEQVAACRAAGIRVYAYYCTTWDNMLAEQHPEWLVMKEDRTSYLPKFDQTPGWTALCLRNEDFVQLMLDDISDLVRRYELDGVWFDMPYPINGSCFCHRCLAELRAKGLDPLDTEVQRADKQQLWTDWQLRSAQLVAEIRPVCEIDQNNNTRIGLGDRATWMSNVDIEALPTGEWGYHYFPVAVRYARSFGIPVTGQTGRFVRSWADVGGLKRPEQLEVEVARIVAQGAQVCIGDQPPPSARLDSAVYSTIAPAYRWLAERETDLEGSAPVVEAAIVAAGSLLADPGRLPSRGTRLHEDTIWSGAIIGAADLLTLHRVQFDVAEPTADLDRYNLLVVPERSHVDQGLVERLRQHLDNGGAVIAAGSALRLDDQAWPSGWTYKGPNPYTVPYLLPTKDAPLPDFPYALYTGADRYQTADGTVLAAIGDPMFERTPEHFTSHSYTPLGRITEDVAAWHRDRFGAFGFDVHTAYLETGYWAYAELFGAVLDAVLPDRLLRTDLPDPIDVALTQRESPNGTVTLLHLTPSFTSRRWGKRTESYSRQPNLRDVSVSVRLNHPVARARLSGTGTPLEIQQRDGRVDVRLSVLDGPTIVVLAEAETD